MPAAGFRPPTFNLVVNIWRFGNAVTNPPDVTAMGQLQAGRRVTSAGSAESSGGNDGIEAYLLLPKLTDIRGITVLVTGYDMVEVPAGTGRYYDCFHVEDIAKGFANEYRQAMIFQNLDAGVAPVWPRPTP